MAEFLQLNLPHPERRSSPAPAPMQSSFNLQWLYENLDTSDVTVNASTVKQIASVAASLRLITSSVRSLPLNVYEIATQRKANAHPAFRLTSRAPNDEQTIDQLLASVVESALLQAGYIQVTRNPTTKVVNGLWYLNPASVTPKRVGSNQQLVYEVLEGGKRQILRPFVDIVPVTGSTSQFDGITPISPLVHSREVFAKALAMQRFQTKFFSNFATPQLALLTKKLVRPEVKQQMRNDWEAMQAGTHAHRLAVLDGETDLKTISSSLKDNDVTALATFAENQCASLFGVDIAMLGSATASATNSSLIETNMQFLRYTLGPWLTAIENGLSRALCDDTHEIRFDTHKLLRMDPKSMSEVAMTMRQAGAITTAEARQIGAGLAPLGDERDGIVLAQVNMTNLPNLTKTLPSQMKGADNNE
jgi:HK97 family phage portal protein